MGLITTDHIRNVIDEIDLNITISSYDILGDDRYKLYSNNTKWASYGKLLSGMTMVEVDMNVSITVESIIEPIESVYQLAKPFFYYGTFLEVNSELIKVKSSNFKLPFIYLHLNAKESFEDDESTIDYVSDCAIYFMVDCDPKNWLRGDHIENAIRPMKQLVKSFESALKNYAYTNAANKISYEENDYASFGEVSISGVIKKIFDDNISGTEMLIKIPFNKSFTACLN